MTSVFRVTFIAARLVPIVVLALTVGGGGAAAAPSATVDLEEEVDVDKPAPPCQSLPFKATVQTVVETAVRPVFLPAAAPNRQARKQQYVGLAIGVVSGSAGKTDMFFYGETVKGNNQLPKANTLFGIGSVSKLFTATLLALYNHRGMLDPPVPHPPGALNAGPTLASILPKKYKLPSPRDEITLVELVTHYSGLPKVPRDPKSNDKEKDFHTGDKDKDLGHLYRAIGALDAQGRCVTTCDTQNGQFCPCEGGCTSCPCALPALSGADGYQYSNIAFHVLGHALASAAKRESFAEANRIEITSPLGMKSTGSKQDLTEQSCVVDKCGYANYTCTYKDKCNGTFSQRAALGYADKCGFATLGKQGSDQPTYLPGAGMWSSTEDLVTFVKYNLGIVDESVPQKARQELLAILPDLHGERAKTFKNGKPTGGIGLGWQIGNLEDKNSPAFIWKGGDIYGFHAYVAFVPSERTGVVVLTNSDLSPHDPNAIGKQILNSLRSSCVAK